MPPDPASAAAAVVTLRAELEMVDSTLESLDRKAALVPALLGVIAGLFIAPDGRFTTAQAVVLVGAMIIGFIAIVEALRALRARNLTVGPEAGQVVAGTHLAAHDFDQAVAASLGIAIASLSEVSEHKARQLNIAISYAAGSIALLAVARVYGGLG